MQDAEKGSGSPSVNLCSCKLLEVRLPVLQKSIPDPGSQRAHMSRMGTCCPGCPKMGLCVVCWHSDMQQGTATQHRQQGEQALHTLT